ncbi:hypothetical protein FISHEDRAFT_41926 [Fistulina hepatica ATCC 64428]|nr:hypothetical protein FISHEDRAFT_41926 [Fistulina hepatica ATCC 64428]
MYLTSRTRQVNAYGKRGTRIVNAQDQKRPSSIFDDVTPVAPIRSRMKRRGGENASPPQIVHIRRKKPIPAVSPVKPVKRRTQIARILDEEPPTGPTTRSPLTPITKRTKAARMPSTKSAPFNHRVSPVRLSNLSPFIEVEIVVLDEDGKTISSQRRTSKKGVEVNPFHESDLPKSIVPVEISSDSEADDIPQPARRLRKTHTRGIISDDESDDSIVAPSKHPSLASLAPLPATSPVQDELPVVVTPPPSSPFLESLDLTPLPEVPAFQPKTRIRPMTPPPSDLHSLKQSFRHLLPPRFPGSASLKPRPLTPIRRGGRRVISPSPSPSVDSSLDLDDMSLDLSQSNDIPLPPPEIPDYLLPLMKECNQQDTGAFEFSTFIECFPRDPIVRGQCARGEQVAFRKIGEASYSEVFGIGDVVLKIIPLRDESARAAGKSSAKNTGTVDLHTHDESDGPWPTDAKDVLKEIIVTRAMGEVSDHFVKLLNAFVVKGRYPERLLELWDAFDAERGSESVRPDTFMLSQLYCIIVLPNGGPDLEAYKFTHGSKNGWRQACSIFWQVTKALSHAEQLVSFEHRDLHWGQILVKNIATGSQRAPLESSIQNTPAKRNARFHSDSEKLTMDDRVHGVFVTLIDLGFARMDAGDGSGGEHIHWTPFDEEIFMGEGDYQFDIYRYMKLANGDSWEDFKPVTNVLWLHYLVKQLMGPKKLRPPVVVPPARSVPANVYSEKECYECLVDIEKWLGSCVKIVQRIGKKAKGRRKKATEPGPLVPACAGEVVEYGIKKGWIHSYRGNSG